MFPWPNIISWLHLFPQPRNVNFYSSVAQPLILDSRWGLHFGCPSKRHHPNNLQYWKAFLTKWTSRMYIQASPCNSLELGELKNKWHNLHFPRKQRALDFFSFLSAICWKWLSFYIYCNILSCFYVLYILSPVKQDLGRKFDKVILCLIFIATNFTHWQN